MFGEIALHFILVITIVTRIYCFPMCGLMCILILVFCLNCLIAFLTSILLPNVKWLSLYIQPMLIYLQCQLVVDDFSNPCAVMNGQLEVRDLRETCLSLTQLDTLFILRATL